MRITHNPMGAEGYDLCRSGDGQSDSPALSACIFSEYKPWVKTSSGSIYPAAWLSICLSQCNAFSFLSLPQNPGPAHGRGPEHAGKTLPPELHKRPQKWRKLA